MRLPNSSYTEMLKKFLSKMAFHVIVCSGDFLWANLSNVNNLSSTYISHSRKFAADGMCRNAL